MSDPPGGTGWERLFRLVFERSANPIALLDEQRRVVDLNEPAAELLGGTHQELTGRSLRESVKRSEREQSDRKWDEFMRTGEYSGSRDLVRSDGSEVAVDFAARLADIDGRRIAIYVAMVSGETEPLPIAAGAGGMGLTDREREVVTLIAMGLDTGDIASRLHISPETVRTHVRNAMGKLDVHTRAQLVAVALCGQQTLHDEHVGDR
jgi:PAS domain S-box-containing protein